METKTKAILMAILNLPQHERQMLMDELKNFDVQNVNEQKIISESLNRSLGPIMGSKCAVCGK